MAWGKEARIITLLVIDVAFFFLEIIVGYAVGSLALVADSFHMLNDVMSLVVALYAVKLSQKGNETRDPRYSYGWQRAEILGALINGVFLLALCFSIFMEALERFINVTEVQNPRLVVVVGSLGLASNIVGLFLFHDHGHSHGGHSHGGHSHDGHDDHVHAHNEDHPHGVDSSHGAAHGNGASPQSPTAGKHHRNSSATRRRERSDSVNSFMGHPAATRAYVVRTAHDLGYDAPPQSGASGSAPGEDENAPLLGRRESSYGATANGSPGDVESGGNGKAPGFVGRLMGKSKSSAGHDEHDHDGAHSHSHSHGGHSHGEGEGSMNMRGVFLHVLGDALGNVGVIASGLFIWLSTTWWRYYTDPAISFLITIIIFHSALPLVKSASFILLQGVPSAVPLDKVHQSLLEVPGVISVHELHIWQLSEAKNVASVHVLIDVDEAHLTEQESHTAAASAADQSNSKGSSTSAEEDGSSRNPAQDKSMLIPHEHRYMDIAAQIRGKLHRFNIHSSTIQPEFVRGGMRSVARAHGVEIDERVTNSSGKLVTTQGELVERTISRNGASACLIACGPDGSCVEAACCPPLPDASSGKSGVNTPAAGAGGADA